MTWQNSSYLSVLRHGTHLFRALGWKRALTVQALGLLSSGLYALGIASLVPVLGLLSGSMPKLPSALAAMLALVPALAGEKSVGTILMLGTLILFLLRALCLSLYYAYGAEVTESYTRTVRNRLLQAYAWDREMQAAENAKTHILYLNSQMPLLTSFNWGIIYCSLQVYTLFVLIAANIYLSPVAFAVSAAIGIIVVPFTQPMLRQISRFGGAVLNIYQHILIQSNNITEGFETVTTLNVQDELQSNVDRLGTRAMHEQYWLGLFQGAVAALPEILIAIVAIAFYLLLGSGGVNGPLIAIAGYSIVRLVGTIGQLNEKTGDLMKLAWMPDQLAQFLDAPRSGIARHRTATRVSAPVQLRFDNVTVFATQRPLVHDASILLPGAGLYQLAGANGSGKSTLLRALAGLMPYSGSITIAGHEVRDLTRASLSGLISYHSQDNFLLEGTFLENVLLGNPARGEPDVRRLLSRTGLEHHPLFAKGLDFVITESAANLSGGEKQLICILRTLLRETPVYLFDEYTNHLSKDVAEQLSGFLRTLTDRVVVAISHHSLSRPDIIVTLDHGRVTNIERQDRATT